MTWQDEDEHFGAAGGGRCSTVPARRAWLQDEIDAAKLRERCARAEQAYEVVRNHLELYRLGDPAAAQALDRAELVLGWRS